jgi:pimeloyl-ACP methyl ester carboxylesterase
VATADVNGVELNYERIGSGQPLVLVHGSWADGRHWLRVARELQDGFAVISYDRRGHGRSAGSHRHIADDVDDLAALIEHADAAPAHVVAGSLGGAVALRLAASRPDLFRSLALHEPALPGLLGGAARGGGQGGPIVERLEAGEDEEAARLFADSSLGDGAWDELGAAERSGFLDNGRVWRAEMADAEAFSIDPATLAGFERPAIVSVGTESPPFFNTIAAALAEALPQAEVRTLQGAGHLPHLSHPREYAELVQSFASAGAAPR